GRPDLRRGVRLELARLDLGLELLLERLEPVAVLRPPGLDVLRADDAPLHQGAGVDLRYRRMRLDLLRHLRLRVRRFVGLVVPVAPVAGSGDSDVAPPTRA